MSIRQGREGQGSYQNTEVQNLFLQASLGPGENNNNERADFAAEVVEPSGIDRDLVAELVAGWFTLNCAVTLQGDATNTTPASTRANAGLGINTDAGDYATLIGDSEAIDSASIGGTTSTAIGRVGEDPGVLWTGHSSAAAAFNDTVSGSGGGGDFQTYTEYVDFRGPLDHGPVVDATDDINASIEIFNEELGGSGLGALSCRLWWQVHEVEGARPQFGLPSP